MKTINFFSMFLIGFIFVLSASAEGSNKQVMNLDPLVAAIDANKDGCMSLEEWQAVKMPMSSFNMLVKDGCVTKKIMLETEGPDGIDLNSDGVLTLEEFLEFDKKMASQGGPPGTPDNRPVISAAERALAMWEVQNTMSKHAYYHAAGMHLEELADIWVSETGSYASTATFASPGWIMKGVAAVKKYYGQVNQDNKVKELENVSKLYPEIKNIPENLGAGHEYAMHTNTTPIIEIAGDGKTAKGIWYSPGIGLSARIQGGNVTYGGTFFWEKYGADFVKEDGEWKIWHCQMFYDWTPSFPESMTSSIGGGPGAPGGPGGQGGPPPSGPTGKGGPGGEDVASEGAIEAGESMSGGSSSDMVDNPNKYQPYSIKRVPSITPRFPEPYYTFSETFSY